MTAATAIRPAARQPYAQAIGTGHLHQALEGARAAARLRSFCDSTGCSPSEVSDDGGHSLSILRVFDAMRRRGYAVSQPIRPQQQLKKGFTTWYVHVEIRGTAFDLGFYTPDTS